MLTGGAGSTSLNKCVYSEIHRVSRHHSGAKVMLVCRCVWGERGEQCEGSEMGKSCTSGSGDARPGARY